ncbi:MAG: alpha/beta fold hydrolase [Xanthomonadales bacterium]|nr:alpha/beta fold hydrolase [Xanthomonadales bacterium]
MRRGYVNIGSAVEPRRIHFRAAGAGPPLIMLHASPMSSAAMVPLMLALADRATVIAPDTPGYGQSDPLGMPGDDLLPYIDALDRFRSGLGITKAGFYGTATGAQIAIEYAKTCTEHVACLILDNAADFTDDDREAIVHDYFPDLSVEDNGAHLMRLWAVARDLMLFFPWHRREPEHRLAQGAISAAASHAMARCYLEAGPDYDRAYRAAFNNEKKERLLGVTAPTTIMRWEGSILKPYTDRFDEMPWPEHFHMQHCGPAMEDRLAGLQSAVDSSLMSAGLETVGAGTLGDRAGDFRFVDTAAGQLHLREAGAGKPLLLLHDLGESGQALSGHVEIMSAARWVLVPDLPGHGQSLVPGDGDYLEQAAAALAQMLDERSVEQCDVMAWGRSAAIGGLLGKRVSRLVLINPVDGPALASQVDLKRETADLEPAADGSHLVKIWAMLYQRQLFHPWYQAEPGQALPGQPAVDGATLNQRLLERIWSAGALAEALASVGLVSLNQAMAEFDGTCKWFLVSDDPLAEISRQTCGKRPWRELPVKPGGWLRAAGLI